MNEDHPIVEGLPPVVSQQSRILILGSMPGEASLKLQQYYGHPRNHFWRLVCQLLGGGEPPAVYEDRLAFVQSRGVALWDVLLTCERRGSLDSAIRRPEVNGFGSFFDQCPRIRHVFFNGQASADLFRRHAAPGLSSRELTYTVLPSSSPARAMSLEAKLAAWEPLRVAWLQHHE